MRREGSKLWLLGAAAALVVILALAFGAWELSRDLGEGQGEESSQTEEPAATPAPEQQGDFTVAETGDIDEGLREDKSVYAQDDPDSLVCFYVTVRYGTEERGTNHTFNEVKNAVRFVDSTHVANDVYAEALVQVGDENGPTPDSVGYGETANNATIRVRGNSSTVMPQKSYKLSLNNSAGLHGDGAALHLPDAEPDEPAAHPGGEPGDRQPPGGRGGGELPELPR